MRYSSAVSQHASGANPQSHPVTKLRAPAHVCRGTPPSPLRRPAETAPSAVRVRASRGMLRLANALRPPYQSHAPWSGCRPERGLTTVGLCWRHDPRPWAPVPSTRSDTNVDRWSNPALRLLPPWLLSSTVTLHTGPATTGVRTRCIRRPIVNRPRSLPDIRRHSCLQSVDLPPNTAASSPLRLSDAPRSSPTAVSAQRRTRHASLSNRKVFSH